MPHPKGKSLSSNAQRNEDEPCGTQSSATRIPGAWPAEGLVDRHYLSDVWLWTACLHGTILDAYTKQLLAYEVSQSLKIDFVLNAVNRLIKIHGVSLQAETLINSDQGSHYTSLKFIQIIRDNHLRQSMSRKANCWDNAPQESFFGHMKDELDLASCSDYNDLLARIDDWADYYNNDRYQWNLALLSPNEYARYLESGVYPLKKSTPTDPFVKPSQDPE